MFFLEQDDIYREDLDGGIEYLEDYSQKGKHLKKITQQEVQAILSEPGNLRSEKNQEYSIMDISSVRFDSNEELQDFLRDTFGINLDKKDGFGQFNRLYHSCIDLYESRYLRGVPLSLRKKRFSNIDQIQKILSNSGEKYLGVYTCDIAKIFFSYARIVKEKKYSEISAVHEQIHHKLLGPIQIDKTNPNGSIVGDFRGATEEITLFSRSKSLESIVGKEIADVKYNSIDNFKDLHGFTFECGSKEDLVLLLYQYYNAGLFVEIPILENKNLLRKEDVNNMDIDEGFKSKLLSAISQSEETYEEKLHKKTGERYKDIKLKGFMNFTDPNDSRSRSNVTGVEIKFILKDNENEKGINFQLLYDYQKRFRELTRLSGIVRQKDILNFVNDFYKTKDEELTRKGKDPTLYTKELYDDLYEKGFIEEKFSIMNENTEKLLLIGIYRYFEDGLQRVKKNKKSDKVYYVNPMYFDLSEAGINEEIIQID